MEKQSPIIPDNEKLVVVWSSGEREVALRTVLLYTYKSITQGWWQDVTLIVWGPSAKLLLEDSLVRNFLQKNIDSGVKVVACKSCSDDYEATEELTGMGIEVRYVGELTTKYIKSGRYVITF